MTDTGAESISSNGNNIRISSFSADNLNRVITLIRNTVGSVQIVPAHASATNQANSDDDDEEEEEEEEEVERSSVAVEDDDSRMLGPSSYVDDAGGLGKSFGGMSISPAQTRQVALAL